MVVIHARGQIGSPITPDPDARDLNLTKRVIGIPGDRVVGRGERVFVNGMPVATAPDVATVAGCPFTVGQKYQPCVTVRWVPAAASRVFVGGKPAVLRLSGPGPGICQSVEQIPQGAPTVSAIQTRVSGM